MLNRCFNPKFAAFKRYGAKGTTVCDRWNPAKDSNAFSHFLSDLGERPSLKHTLDRYPDNEGNYEPSNVRWATRAEQARNRSTTKLTPNNAQVIRQLHAGYESPTSIAEAFNIAVGTVHGIVLNYNWKSNKKISREPLKKNCLHCGTEFLTKYKSKTYCNSKCFKRAARLRAKAQLSSVLFS